MVHSFQRLWRVAVLLACLLVGQTVLAVVIVYRDYFPPNFESDFLFGRREYFYGAYQWAFYAHIVSGPFCLTSGMLLMSDRARHWRPRWHRALGRVHVAVVLLLVAPSGLWMAAYAATGRVAGVGFALLSIATALCAALGWREAVRRRFVQHRLWMTRGYALLVSAVVIRVIGGASQVLGVPGLYPWAAWLSWLLPLAAVEVVNRLPLHHWRLAARGVDRGPSSG